MLWAKRMIPPTFASQSRWSRSSLPAGSVPRNPTSRSSPASAASGPMRAGSGGARVRHAARTAARPSARNAPSARRLATSGRDQPPHALGIHRLADAAVALDERADDHAFRHGQELGHAVGGAPTAVADGPGRDLAPHAVAIASGRLLSRGPAPDAGRHAPCPTAA